MLRLFSVVLSVILAISTAWAQDNNHNLFNEPPPRDKGWQSLANLLEKIEPSTDTRLSLTPSQITDKINALISSGQYDKAIEAITKRKAQREANNAIGSDVQILFLEARAYAASGQTNKAIAAYQNMTINYPELPEPWNNLASEYVLQGNLSLAEEALKTALASDPNYAQARLNLGLVQLMLARESFMQAASSGASQGSKLAEQTSNLLQNH